MANLTTVAPDIMAAILDETLPPELTLFDLALDPPAYSGTELTDHEMNLADRSGGFRPEVDIYVRRRDPLAIDSEPLGS